MDHEHTLGTQLLHHADLNAHQVRMKYAHQRIRRRCRIRQRPQNIEQSPHPHFTAHRRNVLHRRMMIGREHKANAGLFETLRDLGGIEGNCSPQGFEDIGRSGLGRDAAIAVLGNPCARCRGDEHCCGGDIERVSAIAPRANDIDDGSAGADLHRDSELAHDHRRSSDFADRLFFDAQSGQDRGCHHRRDLTEHDLPHEVEHLVLKNLSVLDRSGQGFLGGDYSHRIVSASLRKFRNMA